MSEQEQQRTAVLSAVDLANIELINSELAARLARQGDSSAKVDTKVAFLLGLIATATQFLAGRHPQPVLGALAFVAYMAAFGLGVPALVIRSYKDIDPTELVNGYATGDAKKTLMYLAVGRVSMYENNVKLHNRKTAWWWRSFIMTIVALMLSVIAVVDAGNYDIPTGQHPTPTGNRS